MVARDHARRRQNEAIRIGDGENIAGLGFLASLIGNRLAAFFGGCMTAVEIEVMGVDLVTDAQNAVLKHPLQAAILTPFTIVMVNRMITEFFFSG